MARKNRSPEETARREKIRELLQLADVSSMDDIRYRQALCANWFADLQVNEVSRQ